jgi:hypothetical protein
LGGVEKRTGGEEIIGVYIMVATNLDDWKWFSKESETRI